VSGQTVKYTDVLLTTS